eukprot:2861248-Prorocentrum_lima.AAC.1
MTSSLVGSEMCIRDRSKVSLPTAVWRCHLPAARADKSSEVSPTFLDVLRAEKCALGLPLPCTFAFRGDQRGLGATIAKVIAEPLPARPVDTRSLRAEP